ncbi:ribonuclease HII [Bartonella sp. LJL80]
MSRNTTDLPLFYELPLRPDFSAETRLLAAGCRYVAGVDEVGRGPLAGPVVTAAVILDAAHIPAGLNDSKKLSAKMRARLYEEILQKAIAVSIASLSASAIDRTDIRKAALEAMRRSVAGLAIQPQYVLVDGRDIPPGLPCSADALIKGDQRSVSIAAASIIAKVVRDRMMERAGVVYPAYGFEKHAGYATVIHRTAIEQEGPVKGLHRYSFAPIKGRFTVNLS